jgi:hypothetical protein
MMPEPFEPLLRWRWVDDAGTPQAVVATEAGSMMPEPLEPR